MLLAFHGKSSIKKQFIDRVAAHVKADELVQNYGYWKDGKGCAVGCTLHLSDHGAYETQPGTISFLGDKTMYVMACHESHDAHCIGWLMHQLGPGNNIGLRMAMRGCENMKDVKLVGEQHKRFEDTLP